MLLEFRFTRDYFQRTLDDGSGVCVAEGLFRLVHLGERVTNPPPIIDRFKFDFKFKH